MRQGRAAVLLASCLSAHLVCADIVYQETFDNPALAGKGATGVGADTAPTIDLTGISQWTLDISNTQLTATDDWFRIENNALEARDVDGPAIWLSSAIDIQSFSQIGFSVDVEELGDHESSDYVEIAYSLDGGEFIAVPNWQSFGNDQFTLIGDRPDDADFVATTVQQMIGEGNILQLRISLLNNAGTERLRINQVLVESDFSDDQPPALTGISPADGAQFVAADTSIELTFSEPVLISGDLSLSCTLSGNLSLATTAVDNSYQLIPSQLLESGDLCDLFIAAEQVTDQDGSVDSLETDISLQFSVGNPPIIINEILADPASGEAGDANADGVRDSADDEFVELVNASDVAVDISGWTLSDGAALRHEFPEGSIIQAGCSAVIFGGGSPNGQFGGSLLQLASAGSLGLNNGGDRVTLSSGSASFSVDYSGDLGGDNQSVNRSPDITGGEFAKHSETINSSGELYSPGTQVSGALFNGCQLADLPPRLLSSSPGNSEIEVPLNQAIRLEFSESVSVITNPQLQCSQSGTQFTEVAVNENLVTLQPLGSQVAGETCQLLVASNTIIDLDGSADALSQDIQLEFQTVGQALSCTADFSLISAIQGTTDISPIIGESVLVKAVVTSVNQPLRGFYLQEEIQDSDLNPQSSEAIFVFNPQELAYPELGEQIAVRGQVSEFGEQTQLVLEQDLLKCGTGEVSVADITLPFESREQAESLEGMKVTLPQQLVVSNSSQLGRFGEFTVSSQRLYSPTHLFTPGSPEQQALEALNQLDQLVIDDGSNQQNRDDLPYPTGGLSAFNTLRQGDEIGAGLAGILSVRFGNVALLPEQPPVFIPTNLRSDQPTLERGDITLASFNVLNYFNGDGNGNFAGSFGASNAAELERQSAKLIAAILATEADIIGLIEMENDGYANTSAIFELVSRLNTEIGEERFQFIDTGLGQGSSQSITNAIIYDASRVQPNGDVQILRESNSGSDEQGPLLVERKNRWTIAQQFSLLENEKSIVIAVNHLKAKGSNCNDLSDPDLNDGAGNCNLTRTRAAQAIANFIEQSYNEVPVVLLGDFNAYPKEDPIQLLLNSGYIDAARTINGPLSYGYTFRGQAGALDYALLNGLAADKLVDIEEWHINADEPVALDYNTEFKSDFAISNLYAPTPFRSSDHDPVIISLQLQDPVLFGDINADGAINLRDGFILLRALGSRTGQRRFNPAADLDNNGRINVIDWVIWYVTYRQAR